MWWKLNRLMASVGLVITIVGFLAALSTLSPELLGIFIPATLIVVGCTVAASHRLADEDLGFHMILWGVMTAVLGGFWALAQYYPTYVNTLAFVYLALVGLAIFVTGVRD